MKAGFCMLLAFGAIYCSIASANTDSTILPIQITSVTVGKDQASSLVSTEIKLTNMGSTLANWQLGFVYMQEPMIKLANANPNLTMQICDANNHCVDLDYQKASHMSDLDLSAAYTTILKPHSIFPLNPGEIYTINLAHSNQGLPANYANVPQNFFIINTLNNQISHISTTKNIYHLRDYNQAEVDSQIKEHIANNWNNNINQLNQFPLQNSIIPAPASYVMGSGIYSLNKNVRIHSSLPGNQTVTNMLVSYLANDLNISASVDNSGNDNTGIIIKKISDANLINNNLEGYQIQIMRNSIVISVLNDTGEFYALQTLRQLWNQNKSLPVATITDYPRFKYRGMMLDTARHFFSVNEIKNLLDIMATHKLNTLHIHFSDDEGFRLALDLYPTLKTVGATRGYSQKVAPMVFSQANLDKTNSGTVYPYADTLYSHSYSTADIQQLIAYANARKITIIPEIDIPGHAHSLIKSLPISFVDPNDHSIFTSIQGYTDDVLPVCTYNTSISVGAQFTTDINNIVNEVARLFDGQNTLYAIHNEISVGADEVSANAWTNDSSCQGDWATLTALGKGQKFFQQMAINNQQLTFSGWQQLVQNDDVSLGNAIVPANQTGHIWVWSISKNGIDQAANLAQNNYPTVLAFADQTYFDLTYTPDMDEPGFTWATNFSDTHAALSSATSASITLDKVKSPRQKEKILGIEGALWSETLASYKHLTYMALPKMAGLAEASWSPASSADWKNLSKRLGCGNTGFLHYLYKLYGVHYRGFPHGISLEVPPDQCRS